MKGDTRSLEYGSYPFRFQSSLEQDYTVSYTRTEEYGLQKESLSQGLLVVRRRMRTVFPSTQYGAIAWDLDTRLM